VNTITKHLHTLLLLIALAMPHLLPATPTEADIAALLRRAESNTLHDTYYFNQLYKKASTTSSTTTAYHTLAQSLHQEQQQQLNSIAYARRIDFLGDHVAALEHLSHLRTPQFKQYSGEVRSEYFHALGYIAINSGDPQLALKYYRQAAEISASIDNVELKQAHLSGIGVALNANGQHEEAMHYFEMAQGLETTGENRNSLYLKLNMALTQSSLGNLEQAKQDFKEALQLVRAKKDVFAEIRTLGNVGEILGKQDSVQAAIEWYAQADTLANENGQLLDLIRIKHDLAALHAQLGNHEQAYQLLTEANAINKKYNDDADVSNAIADLETDSELAISDSKTTAMQEERDHEAALKWSMAAVLALVLLLLILIVYYTVRLRRKNHLLLRNAMGSVPKKASKTDADHNALVQRLEELMHKEHVYTAQGLTLDQLAKKAGTNRTYLSEAINTHYGQSFSQWLNQQRVEAVKQLLVDPKNTHLSIEGIATTAGFKSVSTFNTQFKSVTGLTPSYFRKNAAQ